MDLPIVASIFRSSLAIASTALDDAIVLDQRVGQMVAIRTFKRARRWFSPHSAGTVLRPEAVTINGTLPSTSSVRSLPSLCEAQSASAICVMRESIPRDLARIPRIDHADAETLQPTSSGAGPFASVRGR